MSKNVTGLISWLRQWFDDIYALKGEGGNIGLNDVYPVGAIYMSVNNVNPSVLFGGSWEQIQDKFLLASGNTYAIGSTGGSPDAVVVSHNHTQNSHNHTQNSHGHNAQSHAFLETNVGVTNSSKRKMSYSSGDYYYPYQSSNGSFSRHTATAGTTATNNATTATNNSTGVDGTGKNMPPYLVVNIWKRTA